jgi:hypothetical protein
MVLCAACTALACVEEAPQGDETVAEKRCGESPDTYFSAYTMEDLAELADCTVLVGLFQEDSVTELEDLSALNNVRRIEGGINVFRSPGFLTLDGLDNLEVVDGNLSIHLNPNLQSIAALGKLRVVTGNFRVALNEQLPQSEVEQLAARVTVGGTKSLQ